MIEVRNVTHRYNTPSSEGIKALDAVSLSIESGEFVVILGHNGSGKSTFAKLLNGLIIPSSGDVLIDGISTENEQDIWTIRSRVGMVFQNPDNQLVSSIVEDEIAFGPENLGIPRDEMIERINSSLNASGLEKFRKSAPHLLSGGQKQKLAIASVLAMRPRYLVLDEPTAMLDPIGQQEVMATTKELNQKEGITTILVTQNMNEAAYASRVVIFNKGKVELDGKPGEIFSDIDRITSLGLEPPPMTMLAHRLKKAGLSISTKPLS